MAKPISKVPDWVNFQLATHQPVENPMGDLQTTDCDRGCSSCDGLACGGGCNACRGEICEAACVDCPRVTSLNPYHSIRVFGAAKLDMLWNSARPLAAGTPFFLVPDSMNNLGQKTVDIHARQTTLGAAMSGPQMGQFQSGLSVVAVFYDNNILADAYGFLPLQAYGELKNEDWRVAAGLQFDVFSPGVPTVLPFSVLGASGNSGNSF